MKQKRGQRRRRIATVEAAWLAADSQQNFPDTLSICTNTHDIQYLVLARRVGNVDVNRLGLWGRHRLGELP